MSTQLLERLRASRLHRQRHATDLDGLVRDSIALHSTDYATPYLSARARLDELDPDRLFSRLNTGDGLFRVNAMRSTVHVVHARDLPLVLGATGATVCAVGRKQLGGRSDRDLEAGVETLALALEAGPLDNAALKVACPSLAAELRWWVLYSMGLGVVIRADSPRPRSNRTRFALVRHRLPGATPHPADEARRELLARAVRAFGPVTIEDLAWWLPAPKGEVKRALAAATDLVSITAGGTTWWYAAELADAPSPPRDQQGAWVLPYEDALLKGYLDRTAWFAPGLREVVFPRSLEHWSPPNGAAPPPGPPRGVNVSGEARPSLWWGGRVVGRWEERDGGVVWQVHVDVGTEGRAALGDAVARTDAFLSAARLRGGAAD